LWQSPRPKKHRNIGITTQTISEKIEEEVDEIVGEFDPEPVRIPASPPQDSLAAQKARVESLLKGLI